MAVNDKLPDYIGVVGVALLGAGLFGLIILVLSTWWRVVLLIGLGIVALVVAAILQNKVIEQRKKAGGGV